MATPNYYQTNAPSAVPGGDQSQKSTKFGYLDTDQIGTNQWGTGESFQGAGRQAGLAAIRGGMSSANPLDYQGQDKMRNYLTSYLADLPGQAGSSFDTQSQQGFKNLGAQAGNQGNASGASQYGGSYGSAQNQMSNAYLNSQIKAQADAINQANSAQAGLSDIMSNDYNERKFQFDQGNALSKHIQTLMAADQGRTMELADRDNQDSMQNLQMLSSIVNGAVSTGAEFATQSGKKDPNKVDQKNSTYGEEGPGQFSGDQGYGDFMAGNGYGGYSQPQGGYSGQNYFGTTQYGGYGGAGGGY